jgi:hypothetical protein
MLDEAGFDPEAFRFKVWKEPRRPRWPPQLHGKHRCYTNPRNRPRGPDRAGPGRTAEYEVGTGTAAAAKGCCSGKVRSFVLPIVFASGYKILYLRKAILGEACTTTDYLSRVFILH